MAKKILIISYTFPPATGIGGRRWVKYAKYLHREGFDVYVIASKTKSKSKSPWQYDIDEIKNKILYINFPYFNVMSHVHTLFDKIFYRVALQILKLITKGNYYDVSILSEKKIKRIIKKKEKEGYKNIIVTGAPFNILWYVATLKKTHTYLNIISDLRDPWTWGGAYGLSLISKKRYLLEQKKEKEVIELSNFITVPSNKMQNYLKEKYNDFKTKIILLPHAYDDDEFDSVKEYKKKTEKVKIIFGGSVYNGLDSHFLGLAIVISRFREKWEFDFYTKDTNLIPHQVLNQINIYYPLFAKAFFKKVKNADYYLILFPERVKDFISTKFYEIIKLRIPIIIISKKGEASNFITNNRLGVHILPEEIESELPKVIDGLKFEYNENFDISEFSYSKSIDILQKLI